MNSYLTIPDRLYYDFIEPAFVMLFNGISHVIIYPLTAAGVPVPVHIILIAVLTALFAMWLRKKMRVEEKMAAFNQTFAAKREQQKDLQLISDKYTRSMLYEASDHDLDHDYNTFLAHHYSRYVLIYLLPLFLILALLNSFFSESYLLKSTGMPWVLPLPENSYGVQGISVTALFLASYIITLAAGFRLCRYMRN